MKFRELLLAGALVPMGGDFTNTTVTTQSNTGEVQQYQIQQTGCTGSSCTYNVIQEDTSYLRQPKQTTITIDKELK